MLELLWLPCSSQWEGDAPTDLLLLLQCLGRSCSHPIPHQYLLAVILIRPCIQKHKDQSHALTHALCMNKVIEIPLDIKLMGDAMGCS